MRIIGGVWGGRTIQAPSGRDVTRPTTDRVREALASIALSKVKDIERASVLDAFAGSGAFGFEMLSRGAAHATLVERDRRVAALERANARALGAQDRCFVACGDAYQLCKRPGLAGKPFDIVLLDPPYDVKSSQVSELLESMAQNGAFAAGALVLYQRAAQEPPAQVPSLHTEACKKYGRTCVDVLIYPEPQEPNKEE